MADIRAAVSGLWSNPSTWIGGVLPGPNDQALANGFTVTIDQDVDVITLSTEAGLGQFRVSSIPAEGRLVKGNIWANSNTSGRPTVFHVDAPTGFLTIRGNVMGGTRNGCQVHIVNPITVLIDGHLGGPTQVGIHEHRLLLLSAAATVTITGDIYQNSAGSATPQTPVQLGASAHTTVQGNVYGMSSTATSAIDASAISITGGDLTIWGSVYGGQSARTSHGIVASGTAVIDVYGDIHSSGASTGIIAQGTSFVRLHGNLVCNTNIMPVLGNLMLTSDSQHLIYSQDDSANSVILSNYTESTPNPNKVRSGYVYGLEDSLVGTLAVPPASSVAVGSQVAGEEGTASLNASDFWNYEISPDVSAQERLNLSLTPSAMGELLKGGLSGS